MLLYGLDASLVRFDSRNKRFDVRSVLPRTLPISRPDVLPVLLAPVGDFQAAVQDFFALDQFPAEPLELLTVRERDAVVGSTVVIHVDKEGLFFLEDKSINTKTRDTRHHTRPPRTKVPSSASR